MGLPDSRSARSIKSSLIKPPRGTSSAKPPRGNGSTTTGLDKISHDIIKPPLSSNIKRRLTLFISGVWIRSVPKQYLGDIGVAPKSGPVQRRRAVFFISGVWVCAFSE